MRFADPASGDELCRPAPAPPAAPAAIAGGALRLDAAFCRGTAALTTTHGSIGAAVRPGDPGFARLVTGVTRALFPPPRYDRTNGAS
ncbi:MAG: hypothetical protein FJX67_16455 [Alphaproteobacteria bacterium]|nr:hypothetical protein [Alphaproteobacteria bacterium]